MYLAPRPQLSGSLHAISGGNAGAWQTVRAMRELVSAYKTDPTMRQAATSIIFLVPPKDDWGEAQTLFDFVRTHIRYVRDINNVETLYTPDKTLAGRVGDCDDQSTLLATLFECVGYPTRFVVAGYSGGEYEHVYLQVSIGGEWIDCDPTEQHPMGWAPPLPTSMRVERV